jgi:hypothetical protein
MSLTQQVISGMPTGPQLSRSFIDDILGDYMPQAAAMPEEDAQEERGANDRRPVLKLRHGTSKLAVFVNQGEQGIFRTVKLEHSYKNADGNFKPSNSYLSGPWTGRLSQGPRTQPAQRAVALADRGPPARRQLS